MDSYADLNTNGIIDAGDLLAKSFQLTDGQVPMVAGVRNLNYLVTRTNWPSLLPPLHLSNSQFQFLLSGLAGQNYTIQSATNLGANDWQVVLATNLPCNTALITDPKATNSARFYRALVGP